MKIEQEKLSRFEREVLKSGSHESVEDGFCVMEMVAYLAGEKHSDHPACASPVIAAFLRAWNDALDDDARQFLKPYAIRVIGTAATPDIETRRAWLAADWFMRTYLPTWLDLAGFAEEAGAIRALPEIGRATNLAALLPTFCAVEQKASAAWSAGDAKHATWNVAKHAAISAVRSAGEHAAVSAAVHAVRSAGDPKHATWSVALSAARSAARSAGEHAAVSAAVHAAKSAVWSAAEHAAWSVLSPTVDRLQQSAVELLDRMIMVKKGTS